MNDDMPPKAAEPSHPPRFVQLDNGMRQRIYLDSLGRIIIERPEKKRVRNKPAKKKNEAARKARWKNR